MKKDYVKYLSAGTFTAEETIKEIDSWDVNKAVQMAKEITERHGAKPYAFYFTTKGRGEFDLDSKVIKSSPTYYINGEVSTLEEIKSRKLFSDNILISNMECNGWNRVVTTYNPSSRPQPLNDDDIVLNNV